MQSTLTAVFICPLKHWHPLRISVLHTLKISAAQAVKRQRLKSLRHRPRRTAAARRQGRGVANSAVGKWVQNQREDAGGRARAARHGWAWGRRTGPGGRAELLRHLRRPSGLAPPILLAFLPRVLPQLPSDLVALAHRCHLHRVAGGLRTLRALWGKAGLGVGGSGLEGSLGS